MKQKPLAYSLLRRPVSEVQPTSLEYRTHAFSNWHTLPVDNVETDEHGNLILRTRDVELVNCIIRRQPFSLRQCSSSGVILWRGCLYDAGLNLNFALEGGDDFQCYLRYASVSVDDV